MIQAKIPFVIFFLERSGSSHLCSLLDSHPQISCGAEEFTTQHSPNVAPHESPRYIHARKVRLLDPDESQALSHLSAIFSRSEHAAGFKLKYPIQFKRYPEIVNALLEMKNELRVIHLDRKNVLKKFVSKQVLVQQRTGSADFRRSSKTDFEPVQIELQEMLKTLTRFQLQREELKKLVKAFEYRLDVEYEEFNGNQPDLSRRLLDFLQVDAGRELKSKFEKKTPSAIEHSVSNFAELVATLKGTKFEAMLR